MGSAVAHVRAQMPELAADPDDVAERTLDLSEFLVDRLDAHDVGSAYAGTLTYHPTCHSLRMLRLGDRPELLLRSVTGVDLRPLADATECCGFGGTFALRNADVSTAMLSDKLGGWRRPEPRRSVRATRRASCTSAVGSSAAARPRAPSTSQRCSRRERRRPRRAASSVEQSARAALKDATMRANVLRATTTIRARRAAVVAETPDWPELRTAGEALRQRALLRLDELLVRLEAAVTAAGGVVHWARDAAEANALVVDLVSATGERSVVKVKSLTTDEIGLNDALAAAGIEPIETDLAERIVQLAGERPSHLLVPSLHRGRPEIAELLREALDEPGLADDAASLLAAARRHLRDAFLRARRRLRCELRGRGDRDGRRRRVGGNGRMCTTLPETLVTVMGIEKVVEEWDDLGVLLQLLPRSATGERMNPYTSLWTGVVPGGRPPGLPPRPRRRGTHAGPGGPGRGRPFAASAARRASTSVPYTARPAATRTTLSTRGRSGRSCNRSCPASGDARPRSIRVLPLRRVRGRLSGGDRHPPHPRP